LYGYVLGAAVALGALVAWWRTRQAETSGRPHHRVRFGAAAFLLVAGVGYAALGGPIGLSFPERMARSVEGGTVLGPELAALLAGLVVYTASHIAEVVRGSIQSVPKGQSEAATALALPPWHRLRYVILPQALRVAIPPLANQYLNLTKNSSLAVVVGYPELMRITRIGIGSGAPAPQSIAVLMFIYLLISLTIAGVVNIANRRLELRGRR
jgi:general L-amino acid transport system permease protein